MSGRRQGERRGIDLGWFDANKNQLGERRSYEHEDRRADTCALCGKRAAVFVRVDCAGINPEAVPDLLAAAVGALDDIARWDRTGGEASPDGETYAALRAAIAKAKP